MKWCAAAFVCIAATASCGEKKASSGITPIDELKGHGPVDFAKEVQPILRKNCLACHGNLKPKADLNLENPPMIRKGGESGPAVIPGKGADSLLIKICSGQDENSFMPPAKNNVGAKPLKSDQLGILKLWIDQGALGDANAGVEPLVWKPLPSGLNPILAVDITQDAQIAACTRANQVFLYNIAANQLSARLADPELNKDGFGGGADRDYVQSLAFNPDGTLLATGGYRCVKLWRKQPLAETKSFNDPKAKPSAVVSLAFDTAAHRLAKGLADGRVEVWDSESGKLNWAIAAHSGSVNALVFSKDGALLLSGSADRTIRVWNAATGEIAGEIFNPVAVSALAFHDELRQVVSGGTDNLIRVWSLPLHADYEAASLREIKGHGNAITALEFINNGKQLISSSTDGAMILWNFGDGSQVKKFDHGATVVALAARGDGKRFATAGQTRMKLWNADSGQSIVENKGDHAAIDARAAIERDAVFFKAEIEYHKTALQSAEKEQKAAVDALKKAADAKTAAIKDSEQKSEAVKKPAAEKDAAQKVAAEPAAALKKAADAKDAATKAAADAATEAKPAADKAAAAKKASDKSAEAKAAAEKALNDLREKSNGKDPAAKPSPEALKAAEEQFNSAKRANESDIAAQASADKAAQELDAKSKKAAEASAAAEKVVNDLTAKNTEAAAKFKAIEKTFLDAEQASKNAMSARDVAEHTLERAETSLKKADAELTQHKTAQAEFETLLKQSDAKLEAAKKAVADSEKALRALAVSPSNGLIASAGDGGLVSLWSAENGRPGERFVVPQAGINALKFLDDNRLANGTPAGCFVWNITPGWKLERVIGTYGDDSPFSGRVLALNFSADGKWLATGGGVPSRSGEVKVWNAEDGKLFREFKDAHSDTVFGVAFSADGKLLASSGADKFIRIFNLNEGKLVKTFEGHTHHVLGVSWRRDGRTLASAGADKNVKIWDMITGEQKFNIENRFKKEATSVHYLWGQSVVLASSGDATMRTMKDENGNDVKSFGGEKGYIQSSAISADGKTVVAGGDNSILFGFDANDGKQQFMFEPPK